MCFLDLSVSFSGQDGKLVSVTVESNELYTDDQGVLRPRGTGRQQTIEAQLVLRLLVTEERPYLESHFMSAGASFPMPMVEYWNVWTAHRLNACTLSDGQRGPTGLIGTNNADAKATVALLLDDWASGNLGGTRSEIDVARVLSAKGVDYVSWQDWKNLDAIEQANGENKGKIRDKFVSIEEMMAAIRGARDGQGTSP